MCTTWPRFGGAFSCASPPGRPQPMESLNEDQSISVARTRIGVACPISSILSAISRTGSGLSVALLFWEALVFEHERRCGSEVHPTHAATAARHRGHGRLFLWHFGDHRLGGHQETGDRSSILERGAHHLGRIDDALLDHVDIVFGLGVEAESL